LSVGGSVFLNARDQDFEFNVINPSRRMGSADSSQLQRLRPSLTKVTQQRDGNHFPIQDPVILVTHERASSDGERVLQIVTFLG